MWSRFTAHSPAAPPPPSHPTPPGPLSYRILSRGIRQVREMIIISLFDEVEFDDRGSGGYLDDEVTLRREKHFLGSVVVPFQVHRPLPPAERCHAPLMLACSGVPLPPARAF